MRPFPITSLTRLEEINNITHVDNSLGLIGGTGLLPQDRWMWGLHLVWEGRITMPAATGPAAFNADGLPNIIERITVEGNHRGRTGGNHRFVDVRGVDLYDLMSDYQGLTGLIELSPSSFSFTANATNDVRIHYVLPFVPPRVSPLEQIRYLLDAPNYDTLKLTIQLGDQQSLWSTTPTSAATLSAYGSASGSPLLRVSGIYALSGPGKFVGQLPGRTFLYFTEIVGSLMTTSATNQRLADIPRGHFVRAINIKTGTKSTVVTAPNNAYATRSNTILSNVNVYRGLNNSVLKASLYTMLRAQRETQIPYRAADGLAKIDFAGHGALGESFDARPLVAGPTGQVDFYVGADVVGAANQAARFLWEEIRWLPQQR